MKSVFERLALMRESLERLRSETDEPVNQINQRDDSSFNADFVLQLEHVAENLEEAADGLHADSCPVNEVQSQRSSLRIQ